jgi:hypothetical protein
VEEKGATNEDQIAVKDEVEDSERTCTADLDDDSEEEYAFTASSLSPDASEDNEQEDASTADSLLREKK